MSEKQELALKLMWFHEVFENVAVTLNIFNCTARRHLDNNRDGMKLAHE